jgi:hypothetical protein
MCCFSAKHAALRRKSKDWLARNQDNVLEFSLKKRITYNMHILLYYKYVSLVANYFLIHTIEIVCAKFIKYKWLFYYNFILAEF